MPEAIMTGRKRIGRAATRFALIAFALAVLLACACPAAAHAGAWLEGSYLTDMDGNIIDGSHPIDPDTLSRGILFHYFSTSAWAPEARPANVQGYGGAGGLYDSDGAFVQLGVSFFKMNNRHGDGDEIIIRYTPRDLKPGESYTFLHHVTPNIVGEGFGRYYWDTFSASFTVAGGSGDGDQAGYVGGGAVDYGSAAGGTGPAGSTIGDPNSGTGEPSAETGIADDLFAADPDRGSGDLGQAGGQGTLNPLPDSSDARADSASRDSLPFDARNAAAAASAFRAAADRDSRSALDGARAGDETITAGELSQLGQVRQLTAASGPERQAQAQEETQAVLNVVGLPLLFVALCCCMALALPGGALQHLLAMRLGRRRPSRLVA